MAYSYNCTGVIGKIKKKQNIIIIVGDSDGDCSWSLYGRESCTCNGGLEGFGVRVF